VRTNVSVVLCLVTKITRVTHAQNDQAPPHQPEVIVLDDDEPEQVTRSGVATASMLSPLVPPLMLCCTNVTLRHISVNEGAARKDDHRCQTVPRQAETIPQPRTLHCRRFCRTKHSAQFLDRLVRDH